MNRETVNLLVTLDENYLTQLNVMLFSLIRCNPDCEFDVYLLYSDIPGSALAQTERTLAGHGRLLPIRAQDLNLDQAPTTARYPKEIYYRIFAACYLPDILDRVLYLDPDVIVNGSILPLYHTPMEGYYFAAATHIQTFLQKFNAARLGMDDEETYINSGIMLMNLSLLRKEQKEEDVFRFIEKYKNRFILPDQDIISGLYGSRICVIDAFRYNMTERLFQMHALFEKDLTVDWVRKNAVILHYCGRNKPWKENYHGQLDIFYKEAAEASAREIKKEEI